MNDEIELFRDNDGLAVVGSERAIERFMSSTGLATVGASQSTALFKAGATFADAGSQVMANSSRWVKLTEESAQKVKEIGWTPTKTPGVSHAMLGERGDIQSWVQIVTKPTSIITNPAVLTGVAGLMSQRAMQQQMDQIVDYLKVIDAKLDRVLRSQTNVVLARLDGVEMAVREAMSVRGSVGRVSDVTWSKVQSSAQAVHDTVGVALRELGDLADRIEASWSISDLARNTDGAKADVQKWLVVLAQCFKLYDAVDVLELDRVLDGAPEELEAHRLGLQAARQDRLEQVLERTTRLLAQMDVAASRANSKVLFNPQKSRGVVASVNAVAHDVGSFHHVLGIESGQDPAEAKRWKQAMAERWSDALEAGADGVDELKRFGDEAKNRAGATKNKLAVRFAERRKGRSSVDAQHDG
ncbi:MAG: hypothetical protein M9952_14395 [Microthrixaceae bacterium]|nr:hypothetical protein [Microthrixaceae bacterium]